MARFSQTLRKKWWHVPIFVWLMALSLALGIFFVYSIFFVRRTVIEYRPTHSFAISDPEFFGSAHALSEPVPLEGNQVTLLHNGNGIFPAMLEAIRGAKSSVNFEAFLFHSGVVGSQFRDAFIERARAGVTVRLLFDGIGAGPALKDADVDAMRAAGCRVYYYHPLASWRLDRLNRRTHRRILVVDGKVGFTGGVGFADMWLGNGDGPKRWREVHAKIEGPMVAKLQGAFQQHWVRETKEALAGAHEFPALAPAGKMRGQVVPSHSFSIAPIPLIQAVTIASATRRICITNAYCTPTDDQVALLIEAVQRGVAVEMLLPGPHHDQPWTKAAGRTAYGKLLEGGVKIYEFIPAMNHTKAMVADGMFALLGSTNLDSRSASINEEIDLSVYDEAFGAELEGVFDADLKQAKPYTIEEFRQRGLWERLTEAAAWLVRSQL